MNPFNINDMQKRILEMKHMVVQISTDVVSLQGGQSYASSSDSFNGIICHTGCIFTADFKIGCLCPQCGKHVRVQHPTLNLNICLTYIERKKMGGN